MRDGLQENSGIEMSWLRPPGIKPVGGQMPISQQIAPLRGRATWIVFAKMTAFALSVALPLLLVRRLSLHEFGLYKQVFLAVGTAMSMLPLGFGMSAFYFLPREPARRSHVVFNILLFYVAMGGFAFALLVLQPTLLVSLFGSQELSEVSGAIGLAILLWIVSSLLETVTIANQQPRLATAFIIAAQLSKALLLIAAAVLFGSVRALIYAAIIQGAIQSLALLFYLRSHFRGFWKSLDPGMMRMQLSYALPLGIAGLLFSMQMDLHNYFVSNQFGAVSYAIYAIGCFQLPLVGIISESVCSVMIPHISLLQKENRHREIILLTARVMRKLAFIYFPLYAFLIVVGREFIAVLFTSQYLESWPVFAINLTMIPVSILLLDPMLRAYAEQRYFLLKLRIILVTGLFAALWFGTSWLGLTGTIFVVVAAAILERLITAIRVGRIAGVTRRDLWLLGDVGKIALASIATGIVTVIAHYYLSGASPLVVIVVCAAIFSAAYPTFILFVAVLEPDERDAIRRIAQLHRVRWRKRPEPLVEKEG